MGALKRRSLPVEGYSGLLAEFLWDDPQVELTSELLGNISAGFCRELRLERPVNVPPYMGYESYLLHVDTDRHVVYRIESYNAERHTWVGRWPD